MDLSLQPVRYPLWKTFAVGQKVKARPNHSITQPTPSPKSALIKTVGTKYLTVRFNKKPYIQTIKPSQVTQILESPKEIILSTQNHINQIKPRQNNKE